MLPLSLIHILADYHVQDYVREMNLAAVRLARKVADEFTSLTPDKPVSYTHLDVYKRQE